MLCARSCPDWCIYIEGHKELAPPRRAGGKPRTVNKLDRFDIDYALCMYCGICVEVCPFDALFWSPEYEYSEPRSPTCSTTRSELGEWMETVPEAPSPRGRRRSKKGRKVPMLAAGIDVAQNIAFGIIAAVMIVAALGVVTSQQRRARRAVRWSSCSPAWPLSTCCSPAEFVAVTQVLVYIGAVMVLFLFGIMLTRAQHRRATSTSTTSSWLARRARGACCCSACWPTR